MLPTEDWLATTGKNPQEIAIKLEKEIGTVFDDGKRILAPAIRKRLTKAEPGAEAEAGAGAAKPAGGAGGEGEATGASPVPAGGGGGAAAPAEGAAGGPAEGAVEEPAPEGATLPSEGIT